MPKDSKRNWMIPQEMPQFKSSTTLDASVIRNAVVYDDREAQRQIREYGKLNRKIFRELIVHVQLSEES
jgi:hypothetical protein